NWLDGTFPAAQPIARPGARLRLFQWLDPAASPLREMQGDQRLVSAATDDLARRLAEARDNGETTLLATTLPLERARAELPLDDVAILLIAASTERPGKARVVDGMLVLSPGTRGMRLGRVDLDLGDDGRVASWEASVVELTDTVPDAPRMADWYAAYNDALREDYLRQVEARKARLSGQGPYVGAEACTACHRDATEAWHASAHAGALGVLERVGKAFDPNCVVCHSVGFGKEGGFLALDETPGLANVQCESCHGPGRAHVASGGQAYPGARVAAEACAGCHHPHHSPSFDFAAYWPRIAHGRD
ncbi:MAG: cytochrome c family protein, partial [Gammaproteobacteria bacterium]|nr:cytochrome c family protein [Gammaproteobacteria bacterium]